jgi:hypothetical protein
MSERTPSEARNLDIYGNPALEWSRVADALSVDPSENLTYFVGTVRPDGRPHVAGVGALYVDGDIYFVAGPTTRRVRNLAGNPACTIAVRLKGVDVTFEGTAERVGDAAVLERVAARYREGGWPCKVEGDAFTAPFNAPSAGPPPWHLYRFTFDTVFAVAGEEPNGATRWRFGAAARGASS